VEEPCHSAIESTWIYGVRQTEIHTAESTVRKPSAFEFETAIVKLKRHKSPGIDDSQQNCLKRLVEQFALVIAFGIRKNCLRNGGADHCTSP
jgi:hypothetical protein